MIDDLLVDGLATYRLTRLITEDTITEGLREHLPSYPWHCHWCMSIWVGGAVTLARHFHGRHWKYAAYLLALSALEAAAHELLDQ